MNIYKQDLSISRTDHEALNGHKGRVIWLTGLSAAGKSTLANALSLELHELSIRACILDGDNVRFNLNRDLGFSEVDRIENIRRVAEVAKLMMNSGLVVIVALISPFKRDREMARALIGSDDFFEVYVSTPLEVCETRDPKGLYRMAREGKVLHMTGVSSPYEVPESPIYSTHVQGKSIKSMVFDIIKLVFP